MQRQDERRNPTDDNRNYVQPTKPAMDSNETGPEHHTNESKKACKREKPL